MLPSDEAIVVGNEGFLERPLDERVIVGGKQVDPLRDGCRSAVPDETEKRANRSNLTVRGISTVKRKHDGTKVLGLKHAKSIAPHRLVLTARNLRFNSAEPRLPHLKGRNDTDRKGRAEYHVEVSACQNVPKELTVLVRLMSVKRGELAVFRKCEPS